MNYLLKNNRTHTQWSRMLIAVVIFAFLFGIRFFFSTSFSSLSHSIAKPFWSLRDSVFGQQAALGNIVESKGSLISENTALKGEVYNLQLKNLELSAQLAAVNTDFSESRSGTSTSFLSATVISKPPYSPFDTLIIDRGKKDGVAVNDTVYIGENILIGTVTEVENAYSKVILFSSGSNQTPTNVLRSKQGLTASGQGGGNFLITLPKDFDILVGDMLVDTSSLQSVIAQVYSIDSSTQGSFKKVYARIPFNIFQSHTVTIRLTSI